MTAVKLKCTLLGEEQFVFTRWDRLTNKTTQGFIIGLIESVAYAWYVAVLFGWLFNKFVARQS